MCISLNKENEEVDDSEVKRVRVTMRIEVEVLDGSTSMYESE